MRKSVWALSGLRLVCYCTLGQECHGGILIDEYRRQFPDAHDRGDLQSKPRCSAVLNYMSRLREEAQVSEGSSADEGVPVKSVQTVPPYVSFFLKFLADQVSQCRHYSCDVKEFPARFTPRVDAQASDTRVGIGGWLPSIRSDGSIDIWSSYWFSLERTKTRCLTVDI